MPRRRPPCSGETPSLAMAMRMRLRAFLVISIAALARGCWPSAVSSVMPASGSLGAAGAGALMDWLVEVEMETVDIRLWDAPQSSPMLFGSLCRDGRRDSPVHGPV